MGHSPPLVSIQLVKHRVVAVLEHQVEPPLPPEDFQEVDKVGVFELLKVEEAGWLIGVVSLSLSPRQ